MRRLPMRNARRQDALGADFIDEHAVQRATPAAAAPLEPVQDEMRIEI